MWRRYSDESPITGEDLSAFADGRLPRARAARVAAHLREHPEDADRIYDYWRQEAALRSAFDPVLREPPPAWRDMTKRRVGRGRGYAAFAAAATILLAVSFVWRWPDTAPANFTEAVFGAYAQQVAGVQSGGVAPEFADLGLEPLGRRRIRLDDGGGVTEYRYRGRDGRVALYVADTAVSAPGLFRVFERSGAHMVEWTVDGRRYALVGREEASELTRIAVRLRHNLSMPAATLAGAPVGETAPNAGMEPAVDAAGAGDGIIHVPSGDTGKM